MSSVRAGNHTLRALDPLKRLTEEKMASTSNKVAATYLSLNPRSLLCWTLATEE